VPHFKLIFCRERDVMNQCSDFIFWFREPPHIWVILAITWGNHGPVQVQGRRQRGLWFVGACRRASQNPGALRSAVKPLTNLRTPRSVFTCRTPGPRSTVECGLRSAVTCRQNG
jgi:hypothetical protein